MFRATLAGRCELHPAAQIKGTSASNIHQKAFNAQPWSREICSRDSFPCLNVKNCVNLTFRKFYLIHFYSFNSLVNCNALLLVIFIYFFLIHSSSVFLYSLFFKAISLWVFIVCAGSLGAWGGSGGCPSCTHMPKPSVALLTPACLSTSGQDITELLRLENTS